MRVRFVVRVGILPEASFAAASSSGLESIEAIGYIARISSVVFGGRNMNPEHTRRADVKANRTAGQRHVKTLPVLKHIVRKSLAEAAKPGDEIFVDERAFRGIVSLYGAEQVMLSDYVEKNVYSEDTFNKQYEMHKSGSFSNDEFAILAYHTSMDPNSKKHDVYPIAKNLLTSVEKVKARHSFWTTDFVKQSGFPRENLGNHLWQIAINPARKITAEAISEFDKGNVEPVAKIISSAIRETINEMKFIGDSDRKVNSFTLSITMLNHLNQLIDSKGSKLRESVESKLSPGELKDYKVFCFNGVPKALFIATDRGIHKTKFDFFDADLNHLPMKQYYPNNPKIKIPDPEGIKKMFELAHVLTKNFKHCRADFYDINGKIYFGELTFSHFSGMQAMEPREWDEKFGSWLVLKNDA